MPILPFVIGHVELPDAAAAAASPRLAIEKITPSVDEGRFAVKRVVVKPSASRPMFSGMAMIPFPRASSGGRRMRTPGRKCRCSWLRTIAGGESLRRAGLAAMNLRWKAGATPSPSSAMSISKKHEARLDLHLELQEGAISS